MGHAHSKARPVLAPPESYERREPQKASPSSIPSTLRWGKSDNGPSSSHPEQQVATPPMEDVTMITGVDAPKHEEARPSKLMSQVRSRWTAGARASNARRRHPPKLLFALLLYSNAIVPVAACYVFPRRLSHAPTHTATLPHLQNG